MISKEIYTIRNYNDPYLVYANPNGVFFNFGLINKKLGRASNIFQCRETFEAVFYQKSKYIGFCCNGSGGFSIKSTNEFWEKIQKRLKIKEKIVFYPTNLERAFVVYIPAFWRNNSTARSLFTMLLRCSFAFYKGDLNDALNKYSLTNRCRNAVDRFLNGYTKPNFKSIGDGFADFFYKKEKEDLTSLLIHPKQTRLSKQIPKLSIDVKWKNYYT